MTQTTDRTPHETGVVHEVDLAITGMTCASCSARIEKKLGRLEGVDAVVNLATEKARVRYAEPGRSRTSSAPCAPPATGPRSSVVRRHVPRATNWSIPVRAVVLQ